MLTKAQVRAAVAQAIDDPSAARWSAPNLDVLISGVYDNLWGDILEWSPRHVSQLDTLSGVGITTPGFIDLDVAPSKRFLRVQKLVRDGLRYTYAPSDLFVIEDNELKAPTSLVADGYFTFLGRQLWLFPLELTPEVELRYSFLPPSFTGLADGTAISFPDGHESALIYEAAARAFTKGDAESMQQVRTLATDAIARLRSSLSPMLAVSREPRQLDSPLHWGGQ